MYIYQHADESVCGYAASALKVLTARLTRLFFGRFCDLVNSITEETWKGPEEGDCDNDALEVRGLDLLL